jgi:predicted dienelactone hydrolase
VTITNVAQIAHHHGMHPWQDRVYIHGMSRILGHCLCGLLVAAVCCATQASQAAQAINFVGSASRDYVDDSRMNWERTAARPLNTTIWYPTDATVDERQGHSHDANPLFIPLPPTAQDALLSSAHRKYPLILISHGTGGSASGMFWLGYHLAARGYIVAAVNHHGNTGAEPKLDPRGFLLYWERARDISAVLDLLLADPVFSSRIDRQHIGAAGLSLGGYTVMALAGARFNRSEYDRFCSSAERDFTCGPQPEFPDAPRLFQDLKAHDAVVRDSLMRSGDSYRDPRIRAIFAIAPVFGRGFTRADVSDISIPVKIVVGRGDTVAPPATNAQHYAALISGATLVLLPAAVTHYTFVPACTDQGKQTLTRLCYDAPGLDRQKVQTQVGDLAAAFFSRSMH